MIKPINMMKRFRYCFLAILINLTTPFSAFSQVSFNDYRQMNTVVIDAGHGGHDPGASGANSVEKNLTLAIALMTGERLVELYPDIKVLYTRTDDTFVPLHQRATFANQNSADLFISIHCNSNPTPSLRGAETYVMGLHKTTENLEVAKTENAAILAEDNYQENYDGFDPDSDEDYIMLSMMQTANIDQSIDFAMMVQEKLHSVGGVRNRGVKQAGFVVLYLTTMPGVLIETGYLSNAADEAYLLKEENQRKIAHAIAEAIVDYKSKHAPKTTSVTCEMEAIRKSFQPKTEKVYRIGFATFRKTLPEGHPRFKGMNDLWHYYDKNGYNYTFGKADTMEEILKILDNARTNGEIRKRHLRNVKIVETERNEVISVIEPD
jgi:N-acetylmuramoyl-L-alanine amidase